MAPRTCKASSGPLRIAHALQRVLPAAESPEHMRPLADGFMTPKAYRVDRAVELKPSARRVRMVAGRTLAFLHRRMQVFPSEIIVVMAFETEFLLRRLGQLAVVGIVRQMARQTESERHRPVNIARLERLLVVAQETYASRIGKQQLLRLRGVRRMAIGAERNGRMLHLLFKTAMAVVTNIRNLRLQQMFAISGMRPVTDSASKSYRRMPAFPAVGLVVRIFVMTPVAYLRIFSAQKFLVIGRMRIVT